MAVYRDVDALRKARHEIEIAIQAIRSVRENTRHPWTQTRLIGLETRLWNERDRFKKWAET